MVVKIDESEWPYEIMNTKINIFVSSIVIAGVVTKLLLKLKKYI